MERIDATRRIPNKHGTFAALPFQAHRKMIANGTTNDRQRQSLIALPNATLARLTSSTTALVGWEICSAAITVINVRVDGRASAAKLET
jgi:hypothetical protein